MNIPAFLFYTFLTAYTPGPNNIMSMSNAGKYGFKKGFRFNIGVFYGFLVVMALCGLFTTLLYNFIPRVEPIMVYIGAAYILWLAWSIWRDAPHGSQSPALPANSIRSGMLLQFVNVKVILYGITAFTTFILPCFHGYAELAGFALLLSLIGFSGTCCWALFGAVFERLFRDHKKALNLVMALLLVYCAVSLFIK